MTDAFFIKTAARALMPATDQDAELLQHIKIGQPNKLTFKRVRNYGFHQKYFALLNLAFDYWTPPETKADKLLEIVDLPPEKNFDRFRKDIIILAGYYDATYRLNGEIRLEAKSISFANMSEDEFEELYSKTIDVIIKRVLNNYTGDTLRAIVEDIQAFE